MLREQDGKSQVDCEDEVVQNETFNKIDDSFFGTGSPQVQDKLEEREEMGVGEIKVGGSTVNDSVVLILNSNLSQPEPTVEGKRLLEKFSERIHDTSEYWKMQFKTHADSKRLTKAFQ